MMNARRSYDPRRGPSAPELPPFTLRSSRGGNQASETECRAGSRRPRAGSQVDLWLSAERSLCVSEGRGTPE
eukprot:5483519-Alexandrium_andersonii.AAC.1